MLTKNEYEMKRNKGHLNSEVCKTNTKNLTDKELTRNLKRQTRQPKKAVKGNSTTCHNIPITFKLNNTED